MASSSRQNSWIRKKLRKVHRSPPCQSRPIYINSKSKLTDSRVVITDLVPTPHWLAGQRSLGSNASSLIRQSTRDGDRRRGSTPGISLHRPWVIPFHTDRVAATTEALSSKCEGRSRRSGATSLLASGQLPQGADRRELNARGIGNGASPRSPPS